MNWTNVTYDSSNFSAAAPMSWSVTSGNQREFSYALDGTFMFLSFYIIESDVGGTGTAQLKLKIPAGKKTTSYKIAPMQCWTDDHEQVLLGTIEAVPDGTWLNLYRSPILTLSGSNIVGSHSYVGSPLVWDSDCDNTWAIGQIALQVADV